MTYASQAVGNYLLQKAAATGGLDSLQTLKLTYIADGFVLGLLDRSLIEDDIEAWKYGPVIRRLYAGLPPGSSKVTAVGTGEVADLQGDVKLVVDDVFDKYGSLSGLWLSSLTHRPGTPWDLTWKRFGQSAIIPRELIQAHYKRILAGADIGATGL
jgi:uncharacterized phage-associated protein